MRKLNVYLNVLILLVGCNTKQKEYYKDGKLKTEISFEDGKRNGLGIFYFENGKVMIEGNYVNGKEDGLFRLYYETGDLKSESYFKNGEKEGTAIDYYKNGKVHIKTNYTRNKTEGIQEFFYPNGNRKAKLTWRNDEYNVYCEENEENGNIKNDSLKVIINLPKQLTIGKVYTLEIYLSDTTFNCSIYFSEMGKDGFLVGQPKFISMKGEKGYFSFAPAKLGISKQQGFIEVATDEDYNKLYPFKLEYEVVQK